LIGLLIYGDKLLFRIDGVDPGAVPGASTIRKIWGRHRIDTRNKKVTFAQYDTADYRKVIKDQLQ
jgi:hypothetical protein